MAIVIAVDAGTTGVRCIAFDSAGARIGVSYRELTQHYPRPGWVEHDAEEIWDAVRTTLRSEEHTSELQSRQYLVCRLLLAINTHDYIRRRKGSCAASPERRAHVLPRLPRSLPRQASTPAHTTSRLLARRQPLSRLVHARAT